MLQCYTLSLVVHVRACVRMQAECIMRHIAGGVHCMCGRFIIAL